ncbi:MAG: multiple sugar transport system permease protein, partial [Clostridiales bacterium]|nr:multiple sugar transport system permease protein [Clostridiales bacterium]
MRKKVTHKIAKEILLILLLTIGLSVVGMPMLYMISTSLKPNGALYEFPPRFFPAFHEITSENYKYIIGEGKFYINFINSIMVSVITVMVAALVASALGFCIARFDFFGKKTLFAFIMLTMIIPGTTLIVPQYELAVGLKVINKLTGLIPFYIAWVIPYST